MSFYGDQILPMCPYQDAVVPNIEPFMVSVFSFSSIVGETSCPEVFTTSKHSHSLFLRSGVGAGPILGIYISISVLPSRFQVRVRSIGSTKLAKPESTRQDCSQASGPQEDRPAWGDIVLDLKKQKLCWSARVSMV